MRSPMAHFHVKASMEVALSPFHSISQCCVMRLKGPSPATLSRREHYHYRHRLQHYDNTHAQPLKLRVKALDHVFSAFARFKLLKPPQGVTRKSAPGTSPWVWTQDRWQHQSSLLVLPQMWSGQCLESHNPMHQPRMPASLLRSMRSRGTRSSQRDLIQSRSAISATSAVPVRTVDGISVPKSRNFGHLWLTASAFCHLISTFCWITSFRIWGDPILQYV
ncbi:hypothetical protein QBC44DRAFT_160298 [Cladorrhinum sp. PSN332]|nr:hypothetical protein QBC44DRAFT_160298 [Cladorrhinum sp. PSN332]